MVCTLPIAVLSHNHQSFESSLKWLFLLYVYPYKFFCTRSYQQFFIICNGSPKDGTVRFDELSSLNVHTSLMNMIISTGPVTLPWGTPRFLLFFTIYRIIFSPMAFFSFDSASKGQIIYLKHHNSMFFKF